jgi:hypothetical protein
VGQQGGFYAEAQQGGFYAEAQHGGFYAEAQHGEPRQSPSRLDAEPQDAEQERQHQANLDEAKVAAEMVGDGSRRAGPSQLGNMEKGHSVDHLVECPEAIGGAENLGNAVNIGEELMDGEQADKAEEFGNKVGEQREAEVGEGEHQEEGGEQQLSCVEAYTPVPAGRRRQGRTCAAESVRVGWLKMPNTAPPTVKRQTNPMAKSMGVQILEPEVEAEGDGGALAVDADKEHGFKPSNEGQEKEQVDEQVDAKHEDTPP